MDKSASDPVLRVTESVERLTIEEKPISAADRSREIVDLTVITPLFSFFTIFYFQSNDDENISLGNRTGKYCF